MSKGGKGGERVSRESSFIIEIENILLWRNAENTANGNRGQSKIALSSDLDSFSKGKWSSPGRANTLARLRPNKVSKVIKFFRAISVVAYFAQTHGWFSNPLNNLRDPQKSASWET